MLLALALASLFVWMGLLLARDEFWRADVDDSAALPVPADWPDVVAVVPARDEADSIAAVISSLTAQDYPGRFRIILVDDGSSDGTADIARAAAQGQGLTVLPGAPLAAGWTGKLAAVDQGIRAATQGSAPRYLWLTDADIVHSPDTLRSLVARADGDKRVLVSLMAKLRCESLAERMLVPAFVFFFQMLYPFAAVNNPARRIAAAAGGCMLVDRSALERAGGIAAIRSALIDDCALGAALKTEGSIWLGLTERSVSIRPYPHFADVGAMIARSAYAQLGYSPVRLVGTVFGLALVYLAPPLLALFADGAVRWTALLTWLLMAVLFQPILSRYRCSGLWGLGLPLIAAFYAGATLWSAWQYLNKRGGQWKGRVQAAIQ